LPDARTATSDPAPASTLFRRFIVKEDYAIDRVDPRIAGCTAILLLALACLQASPCQAGPHGGRRLEGAREQLIGAWRLAAIEYSGPHGETVDPYYQAGSSGIIIYDSSGWMSVQITAQNRPKWEVPAVRVPHPAAEEDAALKAEAFDTYYSYYGTWDYDAATSVVTHHVKSSIIPAETGLDYAQTATLEGGHLIFTVRSGSPGTETVRKKVWERLPHVKNTKTTR
jgi:Lipocalin-like domain